MKAVIDTNVVFAGLANRSGAAFKIFHRFFRKSFENVRIVNVAAFLTEIEKLYP